MNVYFLLSSGALTVDGACKFPRFEQHGGTLTVNNGFFDSFTITDYKWALPDPRVTYLCGGSYGSIKVEIEGLTCATCSVRVTDLTVSAMRKQSRTL